MNSKPSLLYPVLWFCTPLSGLVLENPLVLTISEHLLNEKRVENRFQLVQFGTALLEETQQQWRAAICLRNPSNAMKRLFATGDEESVGGLAGVG